MILMDATKLDDIDVAILLYAMEDLVNVLGECAFSQAFNDRARIVADELNKEYLNRKLSNVMFEVP